MTGGDSGGARGHDTDTTQQIVVQAGAGRGQDLHHKSSNGEPGSAVPFGNDPPTKLPTARIDDENFFPAPGDRFFHFEIVEEIGRGGFARVYVAKQDTLAHRHVVLKIATLASDEPQKLARLQHANIVPVYSVHAYRGADAICMPYLGRVTLHRVLADYGPACSTRPANGLEFLTRVTAARVCQKDGPLPDAFEALARMSPTETAVWIISQLAGGLAFAHRRGILHRDVKPANILITADAVPMLLDFNVSSDSGPSSAGGRIGGTYAYMAPEHLRAFDGASVDVDERSDLYSLGVILYELLTGHMPHAPVPGAESEEAPLAALIASRIVLPVKPSAINPAVPAVLDAVVLKLLDPSPAQRYRSADDLHADLVLHLANRPLRFVSNGPVWRRVGKWRRRNPRVATALAVAAVALVVLILPAAAMAAELSRQTARAAEVRRAEALNGYAAAARELQTAAVLLGSRTDADMRGQGYALGEAVLDRYGVAEGGEWKSRPEFTLLQAAQQRDLKAGFGELLILMTRVDLQRGSPDRGRRWNRLADRMFDGATRPGAIDRQRAELGDGPKDAAPSPAATEGDLFFDGLDLASAGRCRDALPPLNRFCTVRPDHFQARFVRGICHDALGRSADATADFAVCVALRPDFPHARLNLGLAALKLRRYAEAEAEFTEALELKPNWVPALINRGICRDGLRKPGDAGADYTAALADAACPTRVYFLRARARRAAGDQTGYAADRAEGLRREPADAPSYRTRATWRIEARDFDGAVADFDAALKLYPGDVESLLNKGIVLADHQGKTADALPVFTRLLELAPDHVDARCSRGVYHARLGHAAEARRDAADALKVDSSAYRLFQVAGLFAQLAKSDPKAKDEAVSYLARALRAGFNNPALLDGDTDLDPVRKDPAFEKVLTAVGQIDARSR